MSDDPFDGLGDEVPVPPPGEGVRLIGADEAAEAVERGDAVKRRGRDEKRYGDRPEPPPPDVKPAMRFPLADSADASALERPRPAPVEPRTADDPNAEPLISVGPPSGETSLPHWTEPATGEVPRVIIGEVPDDDDDRWQAFASSAPRWRDQSSDWNIEENLAADLVHDDDTRIGALDERERMGHAEFITFDDLDVPDAGPPAARGSSSDPIRIHSDRRSMAARSGPVRPTRGPVGRDGNDDGGSRRGGGARDRQQAIQVGIAIAAVGVVCLLGGFWVQWLPLLLIEAVIVGAAADFFRAVRTTGFRPITEIGLVAAAALPLAAYAVGEPGVVMVVFLTIAACMAWYLFGVGEGRPLANIAITVAGVAYVGVLGAFASLLLRAGPFPADLAGVQQGARMFWVVAWATVLHDALGYLLGSRIGKTPLSAASPNKTWEGLLVGMAGAVLVTVGWGALGIGVEDVRQALVLGVVLALAAPFGDLAESLIKRDLGVKDMGNLLPSHGGVLDRFDAFLFTLPAAYYTLRVLGLVT